MPTLLVIGFVLGLLSALFFAFYMVPQKVTKMDTPTFLWAMSLGVLGTALFAYLIAGAPAHATLAHKGAGLLCGIVWGLGTLAFAGGIERLGLSLATPIKNTTGVFGTLVGLLLFAEWKTTNPWLCLGGSVLIVLAAIIIGQTGNSATPRHSVAAGIGFSLIAAACYASYLYPLKLVVAKIGYWEFTPWMAAGITLVSTIGVLIRPGGVRALRAYSWQAYGLSLLGGISWALALFCLAGSMVLVDLSVAWSLAQLNTIPAVFLGIYAFHEVDLATHRWKIAFGLIAALLGTLLLGFSK